MAAKVQLWIGNRIILLLGVTTWTELKGQSMRKGGNHICSVVWDCCSQHSCTHRWFGCPLTQTQGHRLLEKQLGPRGHIGLPVHCSQKMLVESEASHRPCCLRMPPSCFLQEHISPQCLMAKGISALDQAHFFPSVLLALFGTWSDKMKLREEIQPEPS